VKRIRVKLRPCQLAAGLCDETRTQLHATFQRDPVGVVNRGITGVDCLMWGGDYPHPETTYPHSRQVLVDLLANVDETDAGAIAGATAARIFGLDRSALVPLEAGASAP
jgi:hypothetical protein